MSNPKPRPEVGQTIYSLNVGNAARNREQVLTPMTVTKVGRKYFTLLHDPQWPRMPVQFYLSNWREHSDYPSSHQLFESERAWLDAKAETEIRHALSGHFRYLDRTDGLTLNQLKRIQEIIHE